MPTEIERWRLRSGSAHCDRELASREEEDEEEEEKKKKTPLLKSNNPHLAGGEIAMRIRQAGCKETADWRGDTTFHIPMSLQKSRLVPSAQRAVIHRPLAQNSLVCSPAYSRPESCLIRCGWGLSVIEAMIQ